MKTGLCATACYARRLRPGKEARPDHNPHAERNLQREARAAALLHDPEQTVTAVAFDLGFGSVSPFTTPFKHPVGTTPEAYQRCVKFSVSGSPLLAGGPLALWVRIRSTFPNSAPDGFGLTDH